MELYGIGMEEILPNMGLIGIGVYIAIRQIRIVIGVIRNRYFQSDFTVRVISRGGWICCALTLIFVVAIITLGDYLYLSKPRNAGMSTLERLILLDSPTIIVCATGILTFTIEVFLGDKIGDDGMLISGKLMPWEYVIEYEMAMWNSLRVRYEKQDKRGRISKGYKIYKFSNRQELGRVMDYLKARYIPERFDQNYSDNGF